MWRSILIAQALFISFALGPNLVWGAVYVVDPQISVETGVRTDQFDWNIAGSIQGTDPNILSELTWEDLQISQLRLRGSLEFAVEGNPRIHPYLSAQFGTGRIFSGENQDSDYDGDNRTLEISRSNNAADQGDVLDLSLAVGQKFFLNAERVALTPLVGYSYRQQDLRLHDGVQTIPAEGPFAGLNSSYDAEWWGPWLGIDISFKPNRRLHLHGSAKYHVVEYYAAGNWNLRSDFAHPLSFEHSADAKGWTQEVGVEYLFRANWSWTLSGSLQEWQTDAGLDRVFLSNGAVSDTRLNEVNWESRSIQFGLNYKF